MMRFMKNFLQGVASSVDVCPSDPPRIIDATERLRESWERTGESIKVSIEQFECEQTS